VRDRQGTTLLLILLLLYAGWQICRGSLFCLEGPPAFFAEKERKNLVLLGRGFPDPGIHQFSDAVTPLDVIKMTGLCAAPEISSERDLLSPLDSGEALEISLVGLEVVEVKRFWMPAGQRIALGIALHPDRMSLPDWEDLPGIGPRTAEIIEKNRQINGDFHTLESIERVPGIGPGRIRKWKKFFQP
jgi:competence protein ComEA